MRLHTVFVTHNRLYLTRQVLQSYLDTITVPYTYIVVDNRSTDGTREWLTASDHPRLLLDRNYYPGYATNRGWELAPASPDYLQRADNDMVFLPGWCEEVNACFRRAWIGQVGLRTAKEENNVATNVGGNSVIRRELWDLGLRYDERPWPRHKPGMSEDSYFSPAVTELGYAWTRVRKHILQSLATNDWDDPYYQKSFGDRRIRKGTVKPIDR